jgi:hypothetical protein
MPATAERRMAQPTRRAGVLDAVGIRLHWWAGFVVAGVVLAAGDAAAAQQLAVDRSGRAFVVDAGASSVRVRSAAPDGPPGPWRTVVRAAEGERVMDAGLSAGGRGIAVVQRARTLRVVTLAGRVVGGGEADFAASAIAPSGAAIVVWFRHREDRRWRLEASIRDAGARRFGAPQPLSPFVRRACCTTVSAAIGQHGRAVVTWTSMSRPTVWAALRGPGRGFGRAQRLTATAADAPKAVMGGVAAVLYSTQHVPLRPTDGLQLRRATSGRFGAAEHVNPGGGVTVADAAVTAAGNVAVAWVDKVHGDRVHLSEARSAGPLAATAELGTNVSPTTLSIDADDEGRAVVAWSQRTSATRERITAATRSAGGAPFGPAAALGHAWMSAEPEQAQLAPNGAVLLWKHDTARRTALALARLP